MLRGSIVALLTPFKNGDIDFDKLAELIEFHIEKGTHAILAMGTTGESPTFSHQEHQDLIEFIIKAVNRRVPVIAGTGSNSTAEALSLSHAAEKMGADYQLTIVPYYNKPSQEGIYRHFATIAEKTNLPMILYNVPGRTGTNMLPDTVARLDADFPNIVGIKEATGNMQQAIEIREKTAKNFMLFSGDDFINFPMLAIGGLGSISVTANIVPDQMSEMHNAWFAGDLERARAIHFNLMPLHRAMFLEGNPVSVKTAAYYAGLLENCDFRLPLAPMSEAGVEKLKGILDAADLLKRK